PFSSKSAPAARSSRGKATTMSATTGAVWRTAGMTYIGYSRLCASIVRSCLKEPYKSEAAEVEKVHYSRSKWTDGKQPKPNDPR
uniref:ATP synthase subunit epsilon, mitochondrial n=1 Tax=Aegilops tauschii subsp. strangulata TaxID=200361 RepID=A0A453JIM9_AEGTS